MFGVTLKTKKHFIYFLICDFEDVAEYSVAGSGLKMKANEDERDAFRFIFDEPKSKTLGEKQQIFAFKKLKPENEGSSEAIRGVNPDRLTDLVNYPKESGVSEVSAPQTQTQGTRHQTRPVSARPLVSDFSPF